MSGTVAGFVSSAKDVGATPTSERVDFDVLLGVRNQAGAEALLQQLSTPGSASYGNWLTTAQFAQRFGATDAQVSTVTSWLKSKGFSVGDLAHGRMSLSVSGTVQQINSAFGTQLRQYAYQGKNLRANRNDLSIPRKLTGIVTGIVHLDQSAVAQPASSGPSETPGSTVTTDTSALSDAPSTKLPGPPPGARYGVQPCSDYYGQKVATDKPAAYGKHWPYDVCGYSGLQLASGYGASGQWRAGNNGKGVTVAITDAYAAPTILQDANTYAQKHGMAPFAAGQFKQLLPKSYDQFKLCDPQGWYGEETLDVESVHSIAPGANVLYVAGSNCTQGLNDAWAKVIDNHLADVVTNSWSDLGEGQPASVINFFNQYALQAALTGITENFSSGDSGDNATVTKKPSIDLPADSPFATAVGGTSVGIGATGGRVFETGWSTSYSTLTKGKYVPAPPGAYSAGGGGGTSKVFAQPFYQAGKVPASMSKRYGNQPARVIPDISMDGDSNTGMRIGETQTFPNGTYYDEFRLGGTSLSSPLLAGMVAVADSAVGHSLGFMNPLYYSMMGTPAIYDVQNVDAAHKAQERTDFANLLNAQGGLVFKLDTLDTPTTIHTARGYDDMTGVGAPSGPAFFAGLKG
jgi:subtilase family serine protease